MLYDKYLIKLTDQEILEFMDKFVNRFGVRQLELVRIPGEGVTLKKYYFDGEVVDKPDIIMLTDYDYKLSEFVDDYDNFKVVYRRAMLDRFGDDYVIDYLFSDYVDNYVLYGNFF